MPDRTYQHLASTYGHRYGHWLDICVKCGATRQYKHGFHWETPSPWMRDGKRTPRCHLPTTKDDIQAGGYGLLKDRWPEAAPESLPRR